MYGIPALPTAGLIPGGRAPMELPKQVIRIGEQALWSSVNFSGQPAVAATSHRMFATQLGQQGAGFPGPLSISETNLKEGGRVPGGYAYDVYAVALHPNFYGKAAAVNVGTVDQPEMTYYNIKLLQAHGVLVWDFLQVQVEIAPIELIGGGGGVFGAVSTNAAAATRASLNSGSGQIWAYRQHPVILPSNATFSMLLNFGSGAPAIGQPLAVNQGGGPGGAVLAACDLSVRCCLLGRFQSAIAIG